MRSRLLTHLDAAIGRPSSELELFLAKSRKAAHLGKLGLEAEARSLVSEVRSQPAAMRLGPIVATLNLAEGLIEYKKGRTSVGTEKWARARAIASSVDFQEVVCVASAWLAFAAYLSEQVSDIDRNVRLAVKAGCLEYPQALSRTTLIMALSFHYCGDYGRSKLYYDLCHRAATACGDETEISALMHDRAAMNIHEMRVAALRSVGEQGTIRVTHTNLESVISYEDLVGIRSLPSLSPQLTAYEHVLNQQWIEAVEAINRSLDSAKSDGFSRLIPALLADRAFSKFMMKREADAKQDLEACMREAQLTDLHRDDRAICFSRLAQVHALMGNEASASQCLSIARTSWEQVREFQMNLRKVMLALDEEFSQFAGMPEADSD